MKRWLTFLLALPFVVAACGLLFLASEGGTRWTVAQLTKGSGGRLAVAAVQGDLLGRLELTGLALATDQAKVTVDRLLLVWQPAQLLRGRLRISEIGASKIFVTLTTPGEEAKEEAGGELPAIRLPLTIELARLALTDISYLSGSAEKPLEIPAVTLAALWQDNVLTVKKLTVELAEMRAELSGQLRPLADYELELDSRLALNIAGLPPLAIKGRLSGDLGRLTLAQELSGEFGARLTAEVAEPLGEQAAWQATVTDLRLPLAALPLAALPATLGGSFQGKGNLRGGRLQGALTLRDEEADLYNLDADFDLAGDLQEKFLRLEKLLVSRPESEKVMEVAARGEYGAGDRPLKLEASWQGLQWPLAGPAQLSSSQGELRLTGGLGAYDLQANMQLAGQQMGPGSLRLRGRGSDQGFTLESLTGEFLAGQLGGRGKVAWQPALAWDVELAGKGVNPGLLAPSWPGHMNLALLSRGSRTREGLELDLEIQELSGELRGQPLAGHGSLAYGPDEIEARELELSLGRARLTAQGQLGPDSSFAWSLLVPDLAQLLEGGQGSIKGEGELRGARKRPSLTADIGAEGLAWKSWSLAGLEMELDHEPERPGSLRLSAKEIRAQDHELASLELSGRGLIRDHKVNLQLGHAQGELALALKGGYEKGLWSGSLSETSLMAPGLGEWSQQGASELTAGPEALSLARTCLRREGVSLCLAGHWQPGGEQGAEFDLTPLPLAWLKPHLPPRIVALSGDFKAEGRYRQDGDGLTGSLAARLSPGTITYGRNQGEEDLQVPHSGGKLDLNAEKGGLAGDLRLGINNNNFAARFQSRDLFQVAEWPKAQVAGRLTLNGADFSFVPLAVPAIDRLAAQVDVDLELGGSLARPRLQGGGGLELARFSLPLFGLDLRDTELTLAVADNVVRLESELRAGGALALNGELDLNEGEFPLHLTLAGQGFRAVNLPNTQVTVSPDLRYERTRGGQALAGQVVLDEVKVLRRHLPRGARAPSDDIVQARAEGGEGQEAEEPRAPLSVDLTVILGDHVHVAAAGLNAFFAGAVKISAKPGEEFRASGEVQVKDGSYRAYNQDLTIERGLISYAGGALDNPGLDIRASRGVDQVVVGVDVIGTAKRPKLTTFSTPAMATNDVISYLVTGKPSNQGANLAIGRQISDRLSIGVGTDTDSGESQFTSRYRLNRHIQVETSSSSRSNAGDITYTFERD
ncbi:MAG: translocation/assembly module TamB domain-containing protein [Thermodesulfobacteriota bacterium]